MSAGIDGSSITAIESYRKNARPAASAHTLSLAVDKATDAVRLSKAATDLSALDKTLSSIPQVDHARMAAIKAAVRAGRYVIDPEAIAARMSHLEWQLAGEPITP